MKAGRNFVFGLCMALDREKPCSNFLSSYRAEKEGYEMIAYMKSYYSYLMRHGLKPSALDFQTMPHENLKKSASPFTFLKTHAKDVLLKQSDENNVSHALLQSSKTQTFLVIQGEAILVEEYDGIIQKESMQRLYSISKSIFSTLIQIAQAERSLGKAGEGFCDFVSNFSDIHKHLCLEHCLNMASGIQFTQGKWPWKDEAKAYLHPDIRFLLTRLASREDPGKHFLYNDYDPLLLCFFLEKSLDIPLIQYFREKLWDALGAMYDGQITIDSRRHRFLKLESGICMTALDLAKFGQMILGGGILGQRELLQSSTLQKMLDFDDFKPSSDYFKFYRNHPWGIFFHEEKGRYRNYWWGYPTEKGGYDYFAMGILGQILYISPEKKAIVIRTGHESGISGWWPRLIRKFIWERL